MPPAEADMMRTQIDVVILIVDPEAAEIIQEVGDQAPEAVQEAEVREVQVVEEVIAVHLMAGAEAVLQEVQTAGQLQEVPVAVIIVEEERVHHQEATVVLPVMAGEPAEGKVVLPHEAGKIFVDPASRK